MVYAIRLLELSSFLNLISTMNTPPTSPQATPDAPKKPKEKRDRPAVEAEDLLEDMNALSMKISRARRALDLDFATWLNMKRQFKDLMETNKDSKFYKFMLSLQDDIEEGHFTKKRKADFVPPKNNWCCNK